MYLVSEVLGSDKPEQNVWGQVHRDISTKLKGLVSEALILIPRGHLKSTLVTQGWTIQQLLKDPTKRVLIGSAEFKHAKRFVNGIKDQISENPKFVSRFGSFKDDNCTKWTAEALDIKGKRHGDKENSITAASIGTDCTSQHYDIIILDDLVNRRFSRSDEMRNKCWNFYMDCLDLLEPNGVLIFIGTRWHFSDIYSKLLEESKSSADRFDFVVNEAALINDKYERRDFKKMLKDPETVTLFPEKFSTKIIERLYNRKRKKAGGEYEFSCQQMNYPVSDTNAAFKIEDIEFIKRLPPTATLYQTIDPAGSERISSDQDDTAICTTAVDVNGDLINVDCFAERTTNLGLFNAAYSEFLKYPTVRKIGLETNFNNLNKLYIKDNYPDMFRKIKDYRASSTSSKRDKILGLQPYVANGKFKVLEHEDGEEYTFGEVTAKLHPGQYKLLLQMIDFGQTEHDDALDAQSEVVRFIPRRPYPTSEERKEYIPNDPITGY